VSVVPINEVKLDVDSELPHVVAAQYQKVLPPLSDVRIHSRTAPAPDIIQAVWKPVSPRLAPAQAGMAPEKGDNSSRSGASAAELRQAIDDSPRHRHVSFAISSPEDAPTAAAYRSPYDELIGLPLVPSVVPFEQSTPDVAAVQLELRPDLGYL
jgi:hypothetical protein